MGLLQFPKGVFFFHQAHLMLLPTLITITVVLGLLIIVIAMRPNDFRVTRSITIDADASKFFQQVNNFHNWDNWSPWAHIDPKMKQSYEGSESGVGAVYRWQGNSSVGEGSQTIVESVPNQLIRIDLEFIKPFPERTLLSSLSFPVASRRVSFGQ